MDAGRPETSPSQIIHMDVPLREDIGAEIDDFLTLALLGVDDEAQELAQTILWRHLRHFPVFAEVADYAIDTNEELLQAQLLATIHGQTIQFDVGDERLFLETVTEILDRKKPLSISWPKTKYQMLEFRRWDSVISCQRLEILLTFTVRHASLLNYVEHRYILSMIREFEDRGMMSEATRFFKILVIAVKRFMQHTPVIFIRDSIQRKFLELINNLEAAEMRTSGTNEKRQIQGDILLANTAFLKLLRTRKDDKPVYDAADFEVEKILAKTQQLLASAFSTLSDTTPRGRLVDLCEALQGELDEMKVAAPAKAQTARPTTLGNRLTNVGTSRDRTRIKTSDMRTAPPTEYAEYEHRSLGSRNEVPAVTRTAKPSQSISQRMMSGSSVTDNQRGVSGAASTQIATYMSSSTWGQSHIPSVDLKTSVDMPIPQKRARSDLQRDILEQRSTIQRIYKYENESSPQRGQPSRSTTHVTARSRKSDLYYDDSESEEDSDYDHERIKDLAGSVSATSVGSTSKVDDPAPRLLTRHSTSVYPVSDSRASLRPPSDNKTAEPDDPLEGFSVAALVLLDRNVVTDTFLEQSATYLRRNPRLVREEDASVWRERARSALRTGDAELSRKLIQQAYLIELSQRYKADGVEKFLRQDNAFKTFIKGSYTTFLLFLNQIEDQGKLRGSRRDMLTPWARFMHWAFQEKILDTLSLPPDSLSAEWAAEASVESKPLHLSPRLIIPQGSSNIPTLENRREAEVDTDKDSDSGPIRQNSRALPPPRSGGSQSSSYREYARDPRTSAVKIRRSNYDGDNAIDKDEDEDEESQRRRTQRPPKKVAGSDDEDDEDDEDDDDFEDAQSKPDPSLQYAISTHSDRASAYYEPRLLPQLLPTRAPKRPSPSIADRATPSELRRQRDTSLSKEKRLNTRSGSSLATPTTMQQVNPITRLSRLLIGFIGQKTYRDCFDYCEDYPRVFEEDLTQLQPVILDLLRQGRREAAERVVERWLMLREASAASIGSLEWMKRLRAVPSRQEALIRNRDTVLRALEERIDEPTSSSAVDTRVPARESPRAPVRAATQTILTKPAVDQTRQKRMAERTSDEQVQSNLGVRGRGR